MDTLELTSRHLTEAEAGTLVFALGGPETVLPRFETWKSTIALDEETLRHLTADQPNQQRRLDVLEPQVRAALELAESIVAKRRRLKVSAGASEFLEARKLMDAARATTREMKAEEKRLLSQRSQRTEAKRRWTSRILFIGIFTGVGLLTLAWLAVNHAISVNARWQTQISTLNVELEQRVEQRTWALQSEISEHKQAKERVAVQAGELAARCRRWRPRHSCSSACWTAYPRALWPRTSREGSSSGTRRWKKSLASARPTCQVKNGLSTTASSCRTQ